MTGEHEVSRAIERPAMFRDAALVHKHWEFCLEFSVHVSIFQNSMPG